MRARLIPAALAVASITAPAALGAQLADATALTLEAARNAVAAAEAEARTAAA